MFRTISRVRLLLGLAALAGVSTATIVGVVTGFFQQLWNGILALWADTLTFVQSLGNEAIWIPIAGAAIVIFFAFAIIHDGF